MDVPGTVCATPRRTGIVQTAHPERPAARKALLVLSPTTGGAGQVEVSAWAGPSLPFYSQSFRYQPPPVPPLPGFGVEQAGEFKFDASGGVSFGAALAWHFAGPLGVLRQQLDPIRFTPGFFQATAGVSVRF